MNQCDSADYLHDQAQELLLQTGILKLLADYASPAFVGSYLYGLMTRREIDVCLPVEKPNPELAFKIGARIALIPQVAEMQYRNEFVLQTVGNPKGIFWCVELLKQQKWKIDLLIASKDEVRKIIQESVLPGPPLPEELRRTILTLKVELSNTAEFQEKFRSTDIYRAVFSDGVRNLSDWKNWVQARTPKKR